MYVSTCMHEIVKFTFENKCINNQLYCGEGCELFIILVYLVFCSQQMVSRMMKLFILADICATHN